MRTEPFKALLPAVALILLAAPHSSAQVTIQNEKGIVVPEQKVGILFEQTCRVVAEEFHLPAAASIRFPVMLVLGNSKQGVIGDETNHIYAIYMDRWNEIQFATAASRIAIQRLVSQRRKAKIVAEILRRAKYVAPVEVEALSKR